MFKGVIKSFLVITILSVFYCDFTHSGGLRTSASILPKSVELDEKYLTQAVVSDLPVALEAKVFDMSDNYIYGATVVYSIESGQECAEIKDGNMLYVKAAGNFVVRAAYDGVYDECQCTAYDLQFSNVQIVSRFENVTVYTQPILLTGNVTVTGIDFPANIHKELVYEITEGPAEIFSGNYIRFTGKGKVGLKAYSRYDKNVFAALEIDVSDPDEDKLVSDDTVFSQNDLTAKNGCSGSVSLFNSFGSIMIIGAFLFFKKGNS